MSSSAPGSGSGSGSEPATLTSCSSSLWPRTQLVLGDGVAGVPLPLPLPLSPSDASRSPGQTWSSQNSKMLRRCSVMCSAGSQVSFWCGGQSPCRLTRYCTPQAVMRLSNRRSTLYISLEARLVGDGVPECSPRAPSLVDSDASPVLLDMIRLLFYSSTCARTNKKQRRAFAPAATASLH